MPKKPLAALIISKMKKSSAPKKSDEMASEDDYGDGEGMVAAAEEIMSALNEGDAEAFAEALRSFVEQC